MTILTVQQVAKVTGYSMSSVYQWAAEGSLPSLHSGRSLRFRLCDVMEFLRQNLNLRLQAALQRRINGENE